MKNVFLATAAILSLLSCTEKQKQPNIIFILADDMGYGDVSYFDNNSKLKTENLDRMAQEGVVFTDAHSSSRKESCLLMRIPVLRSVPRPVTVS